MILEVATVLDGVLASIRNQFGEMSILHIGEAQQKNHAAIPTGAFSLDLALGVGGLPRGRIVECFGHESSGKTTLALQVIANAQKAGGTAAFIDAEHALDLPYASRIGVDISRLLVSQPSSGEEALTICKELICSGVVDVVVVDSVAALTPQAEIDGRVGDDCVGLQERLMSRALRDLAIVAARTNTLCLFTNQVREKIGVVFGDPETTPGGLALKFHASCRLRTQRVGVLKDSIGVAIGNRTRVQVIKNKFASPLVEAEFDIYYSRGVDSEGSVLDVALACGVVRKQDGWFLFGVNRLGRDRDEMSANLKHHAELCTQIAETVRRGVHTSRSRKALMERSAA